MARGRTGPVVSLFAFQDIITAVSGILIVVVLLLALELVEQPEAEASSPAHHAQAIEQALSTAEAERDRLKAEIADAAAITREAAGTSANALRDDIAGLQASLKDVEELVIKLTGEAEELAEMKAAHEVQEFDSADVIVELEEVKRQIAQRMVEIDEAQNDDRVVFTLPRGFNRSGWLVVLGERDVTAAPIGVEAAPTIYEGASSFLNWAEGQRGAYFLLLIRPQGIDTFEQIEDQFRLQDIAYGFDVIGRDRKVLHPQRGAAP